MKDARAIMSDNVKLDALDMLILYSIYTARGEVSRKVINNVVSYGILVRGGKFNPVDEPRLLRALRISHFGWIIPDVDERLRKLAEAGFLELRYEKKGRREVIYAKPKDIHGVFEVVKTALAKELSEARATAILESINEALELYRRGGSEGLVKALEESTYIAGVKYALVGWDGESYAKVMGELNKRGEEIRKKHPDMPGSAEFLELRRRIKEPLL